MALPPKETIIKPRLNSTEIKEVVKHYSVWAFAYLFAIEILSFFLWDSENYSSFFYPLLNQIAITLLLLNFYTLKRKLRFCEFKKYSLLSLIAYYIAGILAMIFKIELFINTVQYFLLGMSFSLFMFTFFSNKSKD